jgi:hypothetical protein
LTLKRIALFRTGGEAIYPSRLRQGNRFFFAWKR